MKKLRELVTDYGVAFAGRFAHALPIQNLDAPATIIDQPRRAQRARRDRYARTARSQHLRQELLCQLQIVTADAVADGQQSAAQSLFDAVQAIAQCALRCLGYHRLHVP
jgi:hypothetical protein